MDDRNGKNPYLAISVALALFATLGVIVVTQVPFKGERPSVPAVHERSEKIRARLWQDPFQAVLDHVKEREESGKQSPDDQDDIVAGVISFSKCEQMDETLKKKLTKRPEGTEVTVLAVMVFGGPYAELRESRIRYRYAVLSGLEELRYYPEDSEHIGCIKISAKKDGKDKKDNKELTLLNIMPFEWLVSNDQKNSL